jgi:hypothetical protein
MAAREMGGLSLADALTLYALLARAGPARYERRRAPVKSRVSAQTGDFPRMRAFA